MTTCLHVIVRNRRRSSDSILELQGFNTVAYTQADSPGGSKVPGAESDIYDCHVLWLESPKAVTRGRFGCLNTPEISGKNLMQKNVESFYHTNTVLVTKLLPGDVFCRLNLHFRFLCTLRIKYQCGDSRGKFGIDSTDSPD